LVTHTKGNNSKRSYKINFWNLTEIKISYFHIPLKNMDGEAFVASLRKMNSHHVKSHQAHTSAEL